MKGTNIMIAMARSVTLCVLVSLLLGACGSSPPVRYFSLSTTVTGGGQDSDDAAVLGLGPLRMAEYLDRTQIVTRGVGAELEVDEFSRWAEPLSPALHRVVSTDVDNLMPGVIVVAFPWESVVRAEVDYRLLGDVTRFDTDSDGLVVLEVQWGSTSVESGEVLIRAHRSRYEAQAQSADDPAAVALAMNDALAKFSRDIANKLEAALED
jgi:hypothetical protein